MHHRLAAILLMCASPSALAQSLGAVQDPRIRYVDYDPNEVVTLEAVVGIVVHVVLEPGETYLAHAFGDAKAWDLAYRQNHVFIKAIATDADSNLTLVTDRRSYHFAVKLLTETGAVPVYELAFRYRERGARKEVRSSRQADLEEAFSRPPTHPNLLYSMSGDLDIAPTNCWDDGRFTSFKFAPETDLPAIYLVDADGKESLVDHHMGGDEIVVVHAVGARWVLRLGKRALAIFNDGFGGLGRPNASGTSAEDVTGIVWR